MPVRVGDRVGVVFRPRLARWRGTERLELEVRALLPEGLKPPRTHGNSAFLDVCVAPCYQNTVPHLPRAVPCWTLKIAC